MSRDPILESGGLNVYGYVGNSGVNGVDVWGLVFDIRGSAAFKSAVLAMIKELSGACDHTGMAVRSMDAGQAVFEIVDSGEDPSCKGPVGSYGGRSGGKICWDPTVEYELWSTTGTVFIADSTRAFVHEIGHVYYEDRDPKNITENENAYAQAHGLPLRDPNKPPIKATTQPR